MPTFSATCSRNVTSPYDYSRRRARRWAYPIRENEVDNIWVQPLDGSRGRQITNFDSEQSQFPLVAGRKEPLHTPRPYRLRRRPAPGIQPLSLTRMICPGAPQKLHQAIFNQCNTEDRKNNSPGTGGGNPFS